MNNDNKFTNLPTDLHLEIVSFLPRYVPNLMRPTVIFGSSSEKMRTSNVVDAAFHEFSRSYDLQFCLEAREFFRQTLEATSEAFIFSPNPSHEIVCIYNSYRNSLHKRTLNRDICNYAICKNNIRKIKRAALLECCKYVHAKNLHFVLLHFVCDDIIAQWRMKSEQNTIKNIMNPQDIYPGQETSMAHMEHRLPICHAQSDTTGVAQDEGLSFIYDNPQNDVIWNGIESILLFLDDLYRVQALHQLPTACLRLVKMVCHGSVLTKVLNSEYYKNAMSHMTDEAQGFEEYLDSFRDKLDFMNSFKKTELYKKVYKLCMYLLTFSIFENLGLTFNLFGYTQFEEEIIRKKYYNRNKFLFTLMDSLSFLMKRGLQIIQTGRVDVLFHSGETYTKWFDQVQLLQQRSQLLSNPEAHGFDEFSFRADLDDAIEKGECIRIVTGENNAVEKKMVINMTNSLRSIRFDLTTRSAAKESRDCPFSMLICGDSGCGKSSLKDILRFHFAKVKNLSTDDRYVFTKHPTAEFWDGFTTDQYCVVLDDVAFMSPTAANGLDPSCAEFLHIINSVPFVPNQASLADKGNTPLRAKLVIATTNTEHLNSHYYFSCPSAAQRRFPYIMKPTVKAQYCVDGKLDTGSVPPIVEGRYPDYWDIEILKVRPGHHTKDMAITESILHTSDINEFLDWYARTILEFEVQQTIIKASVENMRHVVLCQVCKMIRCHCVPQGLVDSLSTFGMALSNFFKCFLVFLAVHDVVYMSILAHIPVLYHMAHQAQMRIAHRYAREILRWQRDRLRTLGQRIVARYNPVYAMAAFTAMYAAYKLYKFAQGSPQTRQDSGIRPQAHQTERENVWYKEDFQLSTFDLNPVITSSKGLERGAFVKLASKSIAYANISTTIEQKSHMVLTCLQGCYYLTNNHHFPVLDGAHKLTVVFQSGKDGVTKNQMMYITEHQLFRLPSQDLCILKLAAIPPRKGLFSYVPKDLENCKNNGFYIIRDTNGEITNPTLTVIKPSTSNVVKGFSGNLWSAYSSEITAKGNCGSPMIASTGLGYVWIGIHQLGNGVTSWVGSNSLNKSWIESIIGGKAILPSDPMLEAQTAVTTLGPLHHKSVFRYIDSGAAEIYGSFLGSRSKGRSRVCATNIQETIVDYGVPVLYTSPEMNSYQPWRIAALEMTNINHKFDTDVIEACVESFIQDIISSGLDVSTIGIYDDFTAVNGAAGVAYVDKINRNTSAGFPWRKSKKFFLKREPPKHGLQDPVSVDEEIMARVDTIIDRYESGSTASPVFSAHLKDEPVTFKKAELKKTRVFAGAPFDWTIVVRKYFLSHIRLVQNNREIFESAPGTVAQSYEWHKLYDYLTLHGADRMIAGDFRAYDKTMSSIFILAAFDILIALSERSGNFKDKDIVVMRGIAHDIAYPIMDFNGDLVRFFGSNPSGHPLTVMINGLVNSLYMRYCYFMLNPNHEAVTFKQNVNLMTYGDDNIMGVSPRINWFNHTTIAKVLNTMQIEYTMPDKTAASVPFVDISTCSFLKRSWRYDTDVGAYLAALEVDSINKMLTVWVRSKSVSEETQAESVISSAIREAFFHGKETYEVFYDMLTQAVEDNDLQRWVTPTTMPTWQTLYEDFWNNSRILKCVPTSMVQTLDETGFDSMSQPKLSLNTSYCWAHQFCCATRLECGVLRSVPERSSNPLFRGDTGILSKAHTKLTRSLSRPVCSNGLTKINQLNDHPDQLVQHTLYDVLNTNGNDVQGTPAHTLNASEGFELQGLEDETSNASATEAQQTLHFSDEVAGDSVNIPAPINYVMSAGAVNAELNDYLSRPAEIIRFTWLEGFAINSTFKPWELYFQLAPIKQKLDYYALLQCNLKVKVVINASPFYYGALLMAYQPLSLFNPAPIVATGGEEQLVLYSQRPHLDIYPQNCQGGEMTLPFVYHREWLDVTSRAAFQDMGTLDFISYTNLLNANGVAGAGVDVVVYAWAEDVRLAGPTVKPSLQGTTKDEYDEEGVISKPASAISRAAGSLGDLPVIGPFMTATSSVFGTVGALANVLGFTNPPILSDVHAFKSSAMPLLATTDISVPFEKLAIDSKNELSIDPRICGADLGDEMLVKSFVERESFLRSVTWDTTSPVGTDIYCMRVTPALARAVAVPSATQLYAVPMMHLAQMFKHWRGDIKVRIKVICTMYHKGRLRISFDPTGALAGTLTAASQTQVYTHVVDIAEKTDVTFNVPYVQSLAYLKTDPYASSGYNNFSGVPGLTNYAGATNGTLTISPISVLTSPVTPSTVQVLVYVSAGDNFEFANPTVIDSTTSYYQVQGDSTYTAQAGDVLYIGDHTSITDDKINLVYMGEACVSLRPFCHRTSLLGTMSDSAATTAGYGYGSYIHIIPRRPRFPGFDLDGGETALGLVSLAPEPYNWVSWTAMTWLEPCFVGQRGSVNWVVHPQQEIGARTSFTVNREQTSAIGPATYYVYDEAPNTRSGIARGALNQGARGMPGMSANSQPVQNTIQVQVPFYGNVKFQTTSANARNSGIIADESNTDAIRTTCVFSPNTAPQKDSVGFTNFYVGAGTDYNLIFFLNIPVVYKYASVPFSA